MDNTSTPLKSSISSQTSVKSPEELFPESLLSDFNLIEFPESRERRLLEIRLVAHLIQNMLVTNGMTDRWLALWRDLIPKLTVQYDAVLYAICAYSATHLLQESNGDADTDILQNARHSYLVLALREQRILCNYMDETNAEAICLSASLMVGTTFTLMWDPSQDTFEAALEWLKISKSVERMFWKISAAISPNVPTAFKIFHSSYQRVREQWRDEGSLDTPFADVFTFICERELNPENRETYRRTLVYINWIHRYSNQGEEASVVMERRMQTFGVQAPAEFIQFVEMRHPLALIVLIHFFGVMAQADGQFWWLQPLKGIGDTVTVRAIRAIKNLLDPDYHPIISWPLQKARLRT